MTVLKEKLSDIKEQYEKAQKLIEEESKSDPVTEPYRSHYKACQVLLDLEQNILNIIQDIPASELDQTKTYSSILCHVLKEIGRIYTFTEELSNGEKYFKKTLERISDDKKDDAMFINVYVDTLNNLSILWSQRENIEQSKEFLEQAEQAYRRFKEKHVQALTISDVFGSPEEIESGKGDIALEKLHTLTLYYMAQVLGNLGDLHKSANYCHQTLKRQIEYNDYEPIDWALNAATLSQYFFTKNALKQSRHLLAAASYMLDKYEQDVCAMDLTEEQKKAKMDVLSHRSADVARCWAKYGLHILSTSKDRLMQDTDEEEAAAAAELGITKDMENITINNEFDEFQTLSLSLYENQVGAEFVLTYDDAKLVFVNAQSWLTKAKEHYTAESEATEYARIVQDHVSLFKYLAFFDDDDANRCKFHRRRADMLEELVTLLNPTFYLVICREIWYELGLTYSTMLDIKLTALENIPSDQRPTPHQLNKINKLCDSSIKSFQKYLDSYNKATETIPKDLSVDEMHPILFAYFHIGRLFYKIITPDKKMQLWNIRNSLKYYEMLVKGSQEHEEAGKMLKAEIGVCKQMTELLPLKIQKLFTEIQNEGN